jgi:hypothetical protein
MEDLTQDEILTVIAYLQAVWTGDFEAEITLSTHHDGAAPLHVLAIDFSAHIARCVAARRLEQESDLADPSQLAEARRQSSDELRLTQLFLETLRLWAKSAADTAVRDLNLAVIAYLATVTHTRQDEIPTMLAALRQSVLSA